MKCLVVFGSSSDKAVYGALAKELDSLKVDYDLRVASAHKTPSLVDELVASGNHDFFIAGAGLSAALPGVVASKTLKPVIGIPVSCAFGGLDAVLSVWQMPSGIPVLGVSLGDVHEAAKIAKLYSSCLERIVVVKRSRDNKAPVLAERAENFFNENRIPCDVVETNVPSFDDNKAVYIDFTELNEIGFVKKTNSSVINVPYLGIDSVASDALRFMNAKTGMWVGLGNAANACLAAVQLVNLKGKHDSFLQVYRKSLADKILAEKP